MSQDGPESARVVPLDYPRGHLRLYSTSTLEFKRRARVCEREPWTVSWLEHHVRAGDVVYDVGANVGAFSLIAATCCGPDGKVLAFEPGYASFARLCDNIVLNQLDDVIVPVPLPLSSASGVIGFTYEGLEPGLSRHRVEALRERTEEQRHRYRQQVLAFRADDLVAALRLPPPTHVKLDVDGWEAHVLRGFGDLLGAASLRTILVEVSRALTDEVTALMEGHGLRLDARYERAEEGQPGLSWYGLFRRPAPAA